MTFDHPLREFAQFSQRDRIEHILKVLPITLIGSNVLAPLVILITFYALEYRQMLTLAWFTAGVVLCGLRLMILGPLRTFLAGGNDYQRMLVLLLVSSIAGGLYWGIGSTLLISHENFLATAVLLITLASTLASSAVAHISHLSMYKAFAVGVCIPLVPFLALSGNLFFQQGAFMGLMLVLMFHYFAKILANYYTELLALRHDQKLLLKTVSEQKDIAESARDSAQQANRTKSRFLAIASHDLRQPLNAMSLLIKPLRTDLLQGKTDRAWDILEQSLGNLRQLLDSLLDISRLDSGAMKPQWGSVNLGELLQALIQEHELTAAERSIQLTACVRHKGSQCDLADADVHTYSDPILLQTIVRNLLGNAIKYNRLNGNVSLVVEEIEHRWKISIVDSGVGISDAEQSLIFDEFYQVTQ